jgi:hypothetical protein
MWDLNGQLKTNDEKLVETMTEIDSVLANIAKEKKQIKRKKTDAKVRHQKHLKELEGKLGSLAETKRWLKAEIRTIRTSRDRISQRILSLWERNREILGIDFHRQGISGWSQILCTLSSDWILSDWFCEQLLALSTILALLIAVGVMYFCMNDINEFQRWAPFTVQVISIASAILQKFLHPSVNWRWAIIGGIVAIMAAASIWGDFKHFLGLMCTLLINGYLCTVTWPGMELIKVSTMQVRANFAERFKDMLETFGFSQSE